MADSDFGVLSTGFSMKTSDDLNSDVISDFQGQFGASCPVTIDKSSMGFIRGILTRSWTFLWQLAQAADNAGTITSDGASLANVLAIRGNGFLAETYSKAFCICVGTNGTSLTAGRLIDNATTSTVWQSTADATIATLTAWAGTTSYALGDLVTHSGKVYYCRTAGTSAGSGGPTTTSTDITDGSVHWYYCGSGTAAVSVEFDAQIIGATIGASGDLTTIGTSVSGWNSVVNPLDATLGQGVETAAQARLRSTQELHTTGSPPLDGIRASILKVSGVTACKMFENTTAVTDSDGLPAGSVEAVVLGGADQDIIDAIGASKAGGIETASASSATPVTGTYVDGEGVSHTIKFSRPAEVDVYIIADIKVDDSTYPSDGDDQVNAAMIAYGDENLVIGYDVIPFQLERAVNVSGVMDFTDLKLGTSPAPSGTSKLSIGSRSIALLDSSRITVNSSTFVP